MCIASFLRIDTTVWSVFDSMLWMARALGMLRMRMRQRCFLDFDLAMASRV